MDEPVAPLLQSNDPVKPDALRTELAQLLTTVTIGVDGINFGAAIPLPGGLVVPDTVWVTV